MINISDYYKKFSKSVNEQLNFTNTLVIVDFDHTLGYQDNIYVYSKSILKKDDSSYLRNLLEKNEIVTLKEIVDYNKNYKNIINSDEIHLIQRLDTFKDELNFLDNDNNYYKYTTEYTLEEFLQDLPLIKETLGKFENNYILSDINNKNKNYLSIEEIIQKQSSNIRLDISCFSEEDIELFKSIKTPKTKTKVISIISPKNFKYNMLDKYTQILTKKNIDKSKLLLKLDIGDNIYKNINTIECIDKYDSVSFNSFKDNNRRLPSDYSDFRSAEKFTSNTKIIKPTKKAILNHYKNKDLIIIATARTKFTTFNKNKQKSDILSKQMVQNFLKKEGLPIGHINNNKIHFFFTGYFDISDVPQDKINLIDNEVVLKKIMFIDEFFKDKNNNIKKLVIYEDNENMIKNINIFMKEFYPEVKLDLILVKNKKLNNYNSFQKKLKNIRLIEKE